MHLIDSLRRAAVRARPRRAAQPGAAAPGASAGAAGPQWRDDGDDWSFTPPHERALARALGLAGGDGCLPWAARARRGRRPGAGRPGLGRADAGALAPGHRPGQPARPRRRCCSTRPARAPCSTPCRNSSPAKASRIAYGAPAALVRGAREAGARCARASLDRVIGRNVDRWLGDDRPIASRCGCCAGCRARCRCCCTRTR